MAFEKMKEKMEGLRKDQTIEAMASLDEQTSKFAPNLFLWAAVGSIIGSATLQIFGRKSYSIFVGQWAPTFLLLGIYSKLNQLAEEGLD